MHLPVPWTRSLALTLPEIIDLDLLAAFSAALPHLESLDLNFGMISEEDQETELYSLRLLLLFLVSCPDLRKLSLREMYDLDGSLHEWTCYRVRLALRNLTHLHLGNISAMNWLEPSVSESELESPDWTLDSLVSFSFVNDVLEEITSNSIEATLKNVSTRAANLQEVSIHFEMFELDWVFAHCFLSAGKSVSCRLTHLELSELTLTPEMIKDLSRYAVNALNPLAS